MSLAPIVQVDSNDLFITGYVIDFPIDGESLLLRDKLVFEGDEEDQYHTYVKGDRLGLIAWKYYKDEPNVGNAARLWFVIADANNIQNPFDLDEWVGKQMLVPDYAKFKLKI